jgi:hypothetical protein
MVVVSANGVYLGALVVEDAYKVGVQGLFNFKKNFGFSVFGDEHEV